MHQIKSWRICVVLLLLAGNSESFSGSHSTCGAGGPAAAPLRRRRGGGSSIGIVDPPAISRHVLRRGEEGRHRRPLLPPTRHDPPRGRGTTTTTTTALFCQLLGMNCAAPTDFTFSFTGFSLRGGGTDIHSDGWGLAFYEGRGLRCFHDPKPAHDSRLAKFVSDHSLRTLNMIAHIRYATAGKTCLENVHPFQREMWGIQWCFAHNGDVPMFKGKIGEIPWIGDTPGERIYNPIGDTDSEAIFCSILNALKAEFDVLPSLPVLHDTLQRLCTEIGDSDEGTILNFLLGCGQHVQFAYSLPGARPGSKVWNGLYYTVREPPFTHASLSDCDYAVDFSDLCTAADRVAVIATKPLTTDEEWIELGKGELILFADGLPYAEREDCYKVELEGHGLVSEVIPQSPTLEEDLRRYAFENSFYAGADI